jgi:ParB/RepB/Spo0J family partition protein
MPPRAPEDSATSRIVARSKLVLAKRRAASAFERFQRETGPQAEYQTNALYARSRPIDVDKIVDDPDFSNFRTYIDPSTLADLETNIELNGLRVPIVVVEAASPGYFHVRAGFRRTSAVRHLGWKMIPAVVLPSDTPESEEYWTNIVENTSREKLSHYEIACAAKLMRDRFGVTGSNFAQKSGHSPDYVYKLLNCVDRLPAEVLESWRRGDRVPFEIYHKLSCMQPLEAVKNLRLFLGQHRIESPSTLADGALKRLQSKKKYPDKLLTIHGIERTQRLLMAIKISATLSEREKQLGLAIVEYCQGGRKRISGIVDDRARPRDDHFATAPSDDLYLEPAPVSPPVAHPGLTQQDTENNAQRTP